MKLVMRLSSVALAVGGLLSACGSSSSSTPGSTFNGASSGGLPGGDGGSSSGSLVGDGGSPDPLSPDAGCATATAQATRSPVYMLFVLDGSGSMAQDSKWAAVKGALLDLFGSMSKDPGAGVGLIVFADSMDSTMGTTGPYPEPGIDVPIAEVTDGQSAAFVDCLSGTPHWNTPTYYALQGGYGELAGYVPAGPLQPGGQKILVLITDGVPTDPYCDTALAGTNYPTNPCVEMAAARYAATPPDGPVLTFVIGTGQFPSSNAEVFDPAWLGTLAQAGGGAPAGCNPSETQSDTNLCYFEVDPTQAASASDLQQEFTTALDSIRGQVLSCTFPLEPTGLGPVDPTKVNVQVDGTTIPQSATDGWTYDDPASPTAIVFNGAACTALKNDPEAQVSIVVGCETQTAN